MPAVLIRACCGSAIRHVATALEERSQPGGVALPRLWPAQPGQLPGGNGSQLPALRRSLHRRKPHSLQYAWAFLLAAMLCYIPANLMPIMLTEMLSGTSAIPS
ncbi:paraquat-inducible protein A [Aquitalea pelogenes]|uniref:paraquat-inducible protein A n=1 Tax=Aquitalea pelogenes TaxID=1293573 RepID=UPI003B8457AD